MKKYVIITCILLCALFAPQPVAAANSVGEETKITEKSVLNVSEITEEQAELCAAVMIDGFEADETVRTPAEGTLSSVSSSALEGEKCLRLTGNDKAGITLSPTKKRTTSNARSLCVCVYIEPAGGAPFDMTVSVSGTEKTVTASSSIPSGVWCAAYMPVGTETAVNIESISVSVSSGASSVVRVSCLIDRVHTATVDGLADKLKYFASDFTAGRGEIHYTNDALLFTLEGSNSYMESSACGYLTYGRYNALAVRIDNSCTAQNITLRLKLDRQYSYTEENSHTLALLPGENVYYFEIGGFRSGVSVDALKIELPGAAEGELAIKSICFSSYRFPAEYAGTVSAYAEDGMLTVSGTLPDYPASSKRICLYRLTPGTDEEEPGSVDGEPYAEASPSSSFKFELPLEENGYSNAHFKYLVRYETKNGHEDAGVAYVRYAKAVKPFAAYKGVKAPEDLSLIPYLKPSAVYTDAYLGEIFDGDGKTEFKFAGKTLYMSEEVLEKYDKIIERCAEEKAFSVLRLIYTPFADAEKYYFVTENEALPDITTAEGASFFTSLLSFFADRYGDKLAAIIPCGDINAAGIQALRGMTADKAEKYAADLIFTAQSVLSAYGKPVMIQVNKDGAQQFLKMLCFDIKEPKDLPLFFETESAKEARDILSGISGSGFAAVLSCPVSTASDAAQLYYGCYGAPGVCADGFTKTDGCAQLYSVIDTTYGASAAEKLAPDAFPDGVSAVYPDIPKPSRTYEDKGGLDMTELPQMLTALYDGSPSENWQSCDACKSIGFEHINEEAAAGLAFDFSSACFGFASYYPAKRASREKIYFRLYADYLPEDVSSLTLRVCAEGDKGTVAGYCALEAETVSVFALQSEAAGRIKCLTFSPVGAEDGFTPRVCVLGIYAEGSDPTDTITEAETETMPEPESQRFDTADVTSSAPEKSGENRARLYVIAISAAIGMFILCGAVIVVLKLRDRRK